MNQQIKNIVDLRLSGKSYNQIVNELGIPKSTVKRIISKHLTEEENRSISSANKDSLRKDINESKVVELRKNYHTVGEIASILNTSETKITIILRKYPELRDIGEEIATSNLKKNSPLDGAKRDEIISLRKEGYSYEDIADIANVSWSTVKKYCSHIKDNDITKMVNERTNQKIAAATKGWWAKQGGLFNYLVSLNLTDEEVFTRLARIGYRIGIKNGMDELRRKEFIYNLFRTYKRTCEK